MRVHSCVLAAALLVTGAAADCAVDDCLQAVQDAASSLRGNDCESFLKVVITPATSTIFSTTSDITTGTTTRTTTHTITSAASEPSKRWLERHEVIDLLMGRAVSDGGPITARATAIPSYASLCASSAAYESACSCLGISATTVTVPTPSITQVIWFVETTTVASIHTVTSYVNASLLGNSTSNKFSNSTGVYLNTTSSGIYSSLTISSDLKDSSSSSTLLETSSSTASTDKYRLKSPSIADATSSTEVSSVLTTSSSTTSSFAQTSSATGFSNTTDFSSASNATTSAGKFLNSTSTSATHPGVASATGFHDGTTGTVGVLNATSSAPFLNSTLAAITNATTASTTSLSDPTSSAVLNSTASALSVNTTSAPFLNTTSAPFLNSTQIAVENSSSSSTAQLWPNSTVSAPFMNITSAPFLNSSAISLVNSTAAPFLNSTLVAPFLNTTTTTTAAPFFNATSLNATTTAPFANTTSSVRFANTTTSSATTTTAATPTSTCVTTSAPFAVRVGQPGGLFDGWYLRLSGDQALFNPSLDQASRFSFDETSADNGQSHLCSSSGAGLVANASAVVAIASNLTDTTGGAVYFVPPKLLDDIENEEHGWYAPLECNSGGSGSGTNGTNGTIGAGNGTTLTCEQGGKEYWVGCGLGLDITSDGDGTAVVDGWNCTAITLSIVYSS